MPNDFITKLAEGIKQKDHRDLVEKEHQLHVAGIIKQKGPLLWKALGEHLKEYVEQLRADLGNAALAADLKFSAPGSTQIAISKSEFPYVHFTGNLALGAQRIDVTSAKANPKATDNRTIPIKGPIEFKVDHEDNVFVVMEGAEYRDADGLAREIMEKLFSL